jgi:DNA mismatch endonuclease (patch repair protein)
VDVFSPQKRSSIMGRVRGVDTSPELTLRRSLHALGYRFRLHARHLPGRPDIVFPARKVAVFVHGCFWHRHHCSRGGMPSSNVAFWRKKLEGNVARDRRVRKSLRRMGWQAVVVWECQLKTRSRLERALNRITTALGRDP